MIEKLYTLYYVNRLDLVLYATCSIIYRAAGYYENHFCDSALSIKIIFIYSFKLLQKLLLYNDCMG